MGTPCWYHEGGVCTGESYKQVVKLTFFRGAALDDPKKLFNSSVEGNVRRAIDFRDGEKINEAAFKQLIRAAVAANRELTTQRSAKKAATKKPAAGKPAAKKPATKKPVAKKPATKPATKKK